MPKPTKGGFYAVKKGRAPGVYQSWDECESQIKGFTGAMYKKFHSAAEAEAWAGVIFKSVTAPLPEKIQSLHKTTAVSTRGTDTVNADPMAPTATVPSSETVRRPVETTAVISRETPISVGVTAAKTTGNRQAVSPNVTDGSGYDVVYCDGACKGNGRVGSIAGIGIWWGRNDPRNISERCPGDQTNNRAELIAIVRILETTPMTNRQLIIKTDSQYSISCVRDWLPNWIRNGFRTASGGAVKNASIIRYLSSLLDQREQKSHKVKLQHVKGHAGEEGNEGADRLANVGAGLPAIEERDWETMTEALKKIPDRNGSSSAVLVETIADRQVTKPEVKAVSPEEIDFQMYVDCLLSDEELQKMGENGEFD